ncbi:hypothetical protein MIMGU_mgv1a022441mg [Erythranthe guttata]|uniref:RING-type domain-containing protein n=1 Tax=Erythranthe guttata TaxID=4155 RepID=A0A022QUT1_ERYGU|nr:hypothetical protein MIMGU_mgv1a022441mg [Erythranthe guttata]
MASLFQFLNHAFTTTMAFSPSYSLIEPTECRVCLSVYEEGNEVRKLKCKHTFHKDCLDTWLQQHHSATCSLCRRVILPEEEVVKHRDRRYWEYYDESDEELIILRYFCTRGIW